MLTSLPALTIDPTKRTIPFNRDMTGFPRLLDPRSRPTGQRLRLPDAPDELPDGLGDGPLAETGVADDELVACAFAPGTGLDCEALVLAYCAGGLVTVFGGGLYDGYAGSGYRGGCRLHLAVSMLTPFGLLRSGLTLDAGKSDYGGAPWISSLLAREGDVCLGAECRLTSRGEVVLHRYITV